MTIYIMAAAYRFFIFIADKTPGEQMYDGLVNAISKAATEFTKLFGTLVGLTSVAADHMDIFTGIGSTLATTFFALEIFSYVTNFDFHGGIETVIKFAMKLVCYQMLISACPTICGAIIGLFTVKPSAGDLDVFGGTFDNITSYSGMEPGVLGLNYITALGPMILVLIVVVVLFGLLTVKLIGIVFETLILQAISPIALSTLFYSQSRSAGIAFIKNFTATCMQWGVLLVCFSAYKNINSSLTLSLSAPGSSYTFVDALLSTISPIISLVCLVTIVSKLSDLTKRALGG